MDLLKNIFKGDKVIWIIFLCLCLISIIEVFSAASTLTYKSGDHWGPITQHSIILMVGAVVVVFLHNVPYKWFQVFPVFLYPISLVLLAFVTLMGIITGDRVNGAARWMTFMGLQFQPSELAKMAVIIAVSFILSKRQDEEGANPKAFKYIMILTGLVLDCSGKPVDSHVAVRRRIHDDVHRAGGGKETPSAGRRTCADCRTRRRYGSCHPCQNAAQYPRTSSPGDLAEPYQRLF